MVCLNQFYWSQICNKEKKKNYKNVDYLILDNKLGFLEEKQMPNNIIINCIDKNFDLKIENLNSKK